MITYECDKCHKTESIAVNGRIMKEKWMPVSPGNDHSHDRILCDACYTLVQGLRRGVLANIELKFIDGEIGK